MISQSQSRPIETYLCAAVWRIAESRGLVRTVPGAAGYNRHDQWQFASRGVSAAIVSVVALLSLLAAFSFDSDCPLNQTLLDGLQALVQLRELLQDGLLGAVDPLDYVPDVGRQG